MSLAPQANYIAVTNKFRRIISLQLKIQSHQHLPLEQHRGSDYTSPQIGFGAAEELF